MLIPFTRAPLLCLSVFNKLHIRSIRGIIYLEILLLSYAQSIIKTHAELNYMYLHTQMFIVLVINLTTGATSSALFRALLSPVLPEFSGSNITLHDPIYRARLTLESD